MDPDLKKEVGFIREVLVNLLGRTLEKSAQGDGPDGLWSNEGVSRLHQTLPCFSDQHQLERVLPSEANLRSPASQNQFLFLELIEKEEALPVLHLIWDLAPKDPSQPKNIRFCFFLFHWNPNNQDERPEIVGFRFEGPEGDSPDEDRPGTHNFFHAQMISEFDQGDEFLERFLKQPKQPWVPTSQPSIPLAANKFGDLLVLMLVSIYGARQLAQIGKTLSNFGEVAERLKSLGIPLS